MFVVNTKNQQKESLLKRVEELVLANKKLAYQNTEKDKRTNELAAVKVELEQQNSCLNKAAIVSETDANFNITFVNDNFCELYGYHREELIGQNHRILNSQKQPDVFFSDMISTISSGKVFKGEVLNKQKGGQLYWMDITIMPFKDLNEKIFKYVAIMFDVNTQTTQKEVLLKQADQLVLANTELAFQNEEKEKRADELDIANKELAFQNEEKQKRAEELILANTELAFQNNEKEKRAEELDIANTELAFQNKEKEKRAEELVLANTELAFQNEEKEKRADELDIANTELAFQNKEKEKRADELDIANTELAFQNKEKEKRADELAIANTELAFQNKEKDNRADELILANKEKQKRANELILANKELAFQTELDVYRSEMERVAHDLTLLIDTANAPIFGIDSKGLVNEWNQTSEKITGFTKDEVLGKDLVQNYITEDYRESVKKVLDDALLGQETANYEFPLFAKDGQRVMVLLNSSTRRDAKGKITGVLGVGQDITELDGYRNELELKVNERTLKLNQALEKQKELNELKSRFVSTASHEFRTPLSSINFAAGSIKKYWAKMEPILVQKKLDKIEDQVLHMTKLLDDILIVGKAEAGKIIQHPIDINLGDFMSEIIDEVSSACEKSHDIELIDVEGLKTTDIFIDEKSGRNIFINLIGNAVKYSPTTKNITVVLSSEKEHTVITITDYGIGISKAELKTIFKPFSRGKNVDLIQGSGLGLTIVKEAIDAIGGKIIVNSTLGNGTSFIIKILKQQHV
ncbi:PAS domain-containing sensor histidine kinase [Maribacter antarcticus]|uniref:PAS domain-containing sensor histidine kinase n=1 Tax=Maribacter antarcticus TaxID=505250 RepID=UPI000A05C7CC|nr:PAS domain S-box protein [Maribacter antarcticus]